MLAHTRAMIAAASFAVLTGKTVGGLYDHAEARDRRIAAQSRENRVQGHDGDRDARFGGTLPEIRDAADGVFVTLEIEGGKARGYDRGTGTFYEVQVTDGLVQLYDHGAAAWFSYDVQDAEAPQSYFRDSEARPA